MARLMKKYPPGTTERWEKIADIMERLPWEVTKMARKVKDVAYQVCVLHTCAHTNTTGSCLEKCQVAKGALPAIPKFPLLPARKSNFWALPALTL